MKSEDKEQVQPRTYIIRLTTTTPLNLILEALLGNRPDVEELHAEVRPALTAAELLAVARAKPGEITPIEGGSDEGGFVPLP